MKLSNETRDLLKNFSTINSNLLIQPGSTVASMSAMKNIVSIAKISEVFEKECAIYDLNEFLSALSLFKNPVLDFQAKHVMIQEEGSKTSIKYVYTPLDMVKPPKTDIRMPEVDVEFTLTHDSFSKIQRAASVLGAPDLKVRADNGEVSLTVTDRKNETSNTFCLIVGETAKSGVSCNFKVENLKMLPGDYSVSVANVGISHFKNKNRDVEYYIALESN